MLVIRRADRPGDLGWVVMAHGEVYAAQFGWNTDFEALVARIVTSYAADHDPVREAAWIAEADGVRVGCVLLVADEKPAEKPAEMPAEMPAVARLRVLLVTPAARGRGVGGRLVGKCLAFAREAGYERVTLWTNDVLVSARRIYQAYGFTLTAEAPHDLFGHGLVGQDWALDLRAGALPAGADAPAARA